MNTKSHQLKGRAKQAAGILTGNKRLESEGRKDRVAGQAEKRMDQVTDKLAQAAHRLGDALHRK
ncbi:MAG: CsbD family protein [Nocardioidaceae bacterium]